MKVKKAPILMRICARAIDYSLFFLLEAMFVAFLPFFIGDLFYLYAIFITPILWIPLEAWMLSRWGTTVGRMFCDIFVRCKKGKLVNYRTALIKACFLKRSEAFSYTETGRLRLTQWGVMIGIILTCWGATILGIPEIDKYTNHYKSTTFIAGWTNYQDFDQGFSVQLPGSPENSSENFPNPYTSDTLTYNQAKSCEGLDKSICYIVGYLELPRSWRFAGSDTILNGALKIAVDKTPGAELSSSTLTRYHGNPAVEFEITQGNTVEKGTLTLIGRTLYRLTVTAPETHTPHDLPHFLDSFQLEYQGVGL